MLCLILYAILLVRAVSIGALMPVISCSCSPFIRIIAMSMICDMENMVHSELFILPSKNIYSIWPATVECYR